MKLSIRFLGIFCLSFFYCCNLGAMNKSLPKKYSELSNEQLIEKLTPAIEIQDLKDVLLTFNNRVKNKQSDSFSYALKAVKFAVDTKNSSLQKIYLSILKNMSKAGYKEGTDFANVLKSKDNEELLAKNKELLQKIRTEKDPEELKKSLITFDMRVRGMQKESFKYALDAAKLKFSETDQYLNEFSLNILKSLVSIGYSDAYPEALSQVKWNIDNIDINIKITSIYILKNLVEIGDKDGIAFAKTLKFEELKLEETKNNTNNNVAVEALKRALAEIDNILGRELKKLQQRIKSIAGSIAAIQMKLMNVKKALIQK